MANLNDIRNRLSQAANSDSDKAASQKQEQLGNNTLNEKSIDNPTISVINQFQKFFDVYHDVEPYIKIDETTKSYIENKSDWIVRLEQEEFPVAFLGSFSAGKSTIINAIFDREILPEGTDSTTAFPTIIRKSEVDRAVVYYINDDAKNLLWNDLCTHIGQKIEKNIAVMPQENRVNHLERIKKEVLEYEKKINKNIDSKPIETLEKLFHGWSLDKYQTLKKYIQIDELMYYVEGYEDALFIDRIEVELQDINIPSHVVLVDLPGLAVANQRHIQFTKEYIQHKAKAFVVCMKPKSLLEGEEIEFLEEINRINPTILQRSFWVINQWETLNDQQKKEEHENFYKKVKQYNFNISNKRFFKFTALNYLYLSCKANGTLSSTKKLHKHTSSYLRSLTYKDFDSLSEEEAKSLLNHEEIKSFSDFVSMLFTYLNTIAKDEFIKNAKSELLQEVLRLEKLLMPEYEMYSNKTNLETEIHSVEISKQLNAFIETLEEKVRQFATQVRNAGKSDLWKEANTVQVEKEIAERISQLNREELKDKLQSGIDNEGVLSRLPSEVEYRVKLTLLMRDKLVLAVEEFFLHRLGRLLLELKEVNKDYLPEAVLKLLEDKLGKRDIAMRLNGLADALFFNYGDEIDRIGLSLNECLGDNLEQRISFALEKYKSELITFIRNLVNDLNKYVRRSVKNHAEYIEEELLKLFFDERERIIIQIAHKINLSEAVAYEQQKQDIIRTSYDTLAKLKDEL
ncbi:dynamin family protein [Nostoc linckia FACHB-104]|nr:dynamin family protein [Nostoc linckia FACHB-104]